MPAKLHFNQPDSTMGDIVDAIEIPVALFVVHVRSFGSDDLQWIVTIEELGADATTNGGTSVPLPRVRTYGM